MMFYSVLNEKVLRIGEMNSIIKDLLASYQYQPENEVVVIQPIRVTERELSKEVKVNRRVAQKKKNDEEGLILREMIELVKLENEVTDADFLELLKEIPEDEDDDD